MGGKSKKTTVGYWYLPAFHAGLGIGPIDAFLEFRGGDKPAWQGELLASGTIQINAPNLWGGEKDQGGIVGDVDVMFGEAEQLPNTYLTSVFGEQQPAWRGLSTLVFKGGKYGAMNPYPQKASYKIRKIVSGWDGDCWYPEKAEITYRTFNAAGRPWRYLVVSNDDGTDRSSPSFDDSGWGIGYAPFASSPWEYPGEFGFGTTPATEVPDGQKVWMRTTVSFSKVPVGARFQAFVDNDCRLYINGTLAVTVGGNNGAYYDVPIPDGLFVAGDNHIAVEGWDRHSGAGNWFWFDWRITMALDVKSMNPAHILYYSRTNSDMGRESPAAINEVSFVAAANWFHSEAFGLCTAYDPSAESVEEFEQRICRVAGCSLTRSLIDGQWYLDVANGEYDLESLPILTDDDILEFEEQPTLLDSAVNSVSIKYFDPELKEAIVTPPTQAPALIADFGTNHLTIEYLEIPNGELALRVAQREMLARVTPLRGFPLKTTRKPYAWRPSTYFRLQTPKRGISDMVCIFSEKSSGQLRSGAMTISATQDVYSVPSSTFIEIEHGVDTRPSQTPEPITAQRAFEAPYIDLVTALTSSDLSALPDDVGFLEAVAADPAASRDFTMMVQPVGGEYAMVANGDWCPSVLVVEAAGPMDTAFTMSAGHRLSEVSAGVPALWGDEIVRVDVIDVAGGTITVARGCADTVPASHDAGSRLWFWSDDAATDLTQYTDGETVNVKLLTNTGSQQLSLASATAIPITFDQRQVRPYPPANVKMDDISIFDSPAITGFGVLTWSHRDRLQQADQLIDFTVASIGPEAGVTYTLYVTDDSDNPVDTIPGLIGSSYVYNPETGGNRKFRLVAVRDGIESWQSPSWEGVVNSSFTILGQAPLGQREGQAVSWQYTTSGTVTASVTWSIIEGALPSGLTLNASTGEVTGTPTEGSYSWIVAATDAADVQAAKSDAAVVSEPVPDSAAIRRSVRVKVTNYWEFNGSNVDAGRAGQHLSSGTLAYADAGNGRQCLAASTTGARSSGSTNCVGMNLYHSKNRFSFGARVRTSQTDLATLFAIGTGGATTPSTHLAYVTLVAGVLRAFVRAANNDLFILIDSQARDLTSFRQIAIDGDGSFFRLRVDGEEVASVAAGDAAMKRAGANSGMFVVGAANPIGLDVQDLFWAHDTLTVDELKFLNNAGIGRPYTYFGAEPLVETSYDSFVVAMNPVTFYKLNETTGSSVANSAPGSAIGAGSLSGASLDSVAAPNGFPGEKSIKFGGGNTGITLPAIDLSSFGASFALSAFIWLDGSNNYGRYFHLGQGTTNTYAITLNQSSTSYGIFSQVFNSSGGWIGFVTGESGTISKASIFTTGAWKQVSLQYDGSTMVLSCWVDGLCVDAGRLSSAPPSVNRTGSYLFRSGNTTEGSNGRISRAAMVSATGQNPISPTDLTKMYLLGMGL